jgi:hypothetical protein
MVNLSPSQRDLLLYLSNQARFRSLHRLLSGLPLEQRTNNLMYLVNCTLVEKVYCSIELEYKVTQLGWSYIDGFNKEQLLVEDTKTGND